MPREWFEKTIADKSVMVARSCGQVVSLKAQMVEFSQRGNRHVMLAYDEPVSQLIERTAGHRQSDNRGRVA